MKKCYVVSGRTRFQDLGDAIEEAKESLFTKLRLRNIKNPIFTMRDTGTHIVIKATYDNYGNSYNRGSRSVSIRCDEIKPSTNYKKIASEYANFSL